MAKAIKANCAHCDGKMPVGASFCPSCAYPTPWCSYDERIQWEVLQYRKLRARPVEARIGAAVGAVANDEPARSYRRDAVLKQPVTVKIEKRFGQGAVATKEKRSGEQVAEALAVEAPVVETQSAVVEAPPDVEASIEAVGVEPVVDRRRPAAPRADGTTSARHVTEHKPVQRVRRPALPKPPVPESKPVASVSEDLLAQKVYLIEKLTLRVEQLEAQVEELTDALARKDQRPQSWWRRFLGD